MIHYHGTPITPVRILHELAGRHFCVSFADSRDIAVCHDIGQSVMIDNGAYTYWQRNRIQNTVRTWSAYYTWVRPWLDYQTTWCVIPDLIDGSEQENDAMIQEWCSKVGMLGFRAAPVWHIHESIDRLWHLVAGWPRVCFGSSGDYAQVGSPRWNNRMNAVFNEICRGSGTPPAWIHMLRGMSLSGSIYPFASVDSTDIARNHEQVQGRAPRMAHSWDGINNPARWTEQPIQSVIDLTESST